MELHYITTIQTFHTKAIHVRNLIKINTRQNFKKYLTGRQREFRKEKLVLMMQSEKLKTGKKGTNMGKNIKGLAGSTIFNQKMVDQMNGINKNNKGKASPIYIPTKKRK